MCLLSGCATFEFKAARNHLGLGRYTDAIESLERLKALKTPPDGIDQVLAQSYRAHAADLIGRGDCVNAGRSLSKALFVSKAKHRGSTGLRTMSTRDRTSSG